LLGKGLNEETGPLAEPRRDVLLVGEVRLIGRQRLVELLDDELS
jgi:hypothetical protein